MYVCGKVSISESVKEKNHIRYLTDTVVLQFHCVVIHTRASLEEMVQKFPDYKPPVVLHSKSLTPLRSLYQPTIVKLTLQNLRNKYAKIKVDLKTLDTIMTQ